MDTPKNHERPWIEILQDPNAPQEQKARIYRIHRGIGERISALQEDPAAGLRPPKEYDEFVLGIPIEHPMPPYSSLNSRS